MSDSSRTSHLPAAIQDLHDRLDAVRSAADALALAYRNGTYPSNEQQRDFVWGLAVRMDDDLATLGAYWDAATTRD